MIQSSGEATASQRVTMIAVLACLLTMAPVASRAQTPEKYETWLKEEVVYLITDQERDVFSQLETESEFEAFVRGFWVARDPTPGTTRNEFRDEFEKRRREANQLFRGYGATGWRTDRGRIYMLLGPPRERRTYDQASEVWPIELWFYRVEHPKLPPFFYILYYRRSGVGTYRMWDPIGEGPGVLMTQFGRGVTSFDKMQAYRVLQTIDTDLYQAVTAPVPGESSVSSQFEFQQVISVLEDYPNQTLNADTARFYEPGRGVVDTDYAFRQLSMLTLTALLPSANGPFLHFAVHIEPQDLFYKRYQETYYTVFDVEAELYSGDVLVYRLDNRHEIEVPSSRWDDVETRPASLQTRFPVIPGEYTLRLLIRNRIGRIYDSLERSVRVPEHIAASRVLPAIDFENVEQLRGQMAFHFDETLVVPNPQAEFFANDKLRAFTVLAPGGLDESMALSARVVQGDNVVHALDREFPASPRAEAQLLAFEIGLGDVDPGDYVLKLELGGDVKRELPFVVTTGGSSPPLVNSPSEAPSADGQWNIERARQHLALEQNALALDELERAVASNPKLETARLQHGLLALGLGQPERALESLQAGLHLAPFSYELLALAGYAAEQVDELERAVGFYESARSSVKVDARLLSALASLYDRMGESEKAEEVRKEMNP